MIRGGGGRAVLQFMDGPYEVRVESDGGFEWSVRLIERGRTIDAGMVDGSGFGASLRAAVVAVGGRATGLLAHLDKALAAAS